MTTKIMPLHSNDNQVTMNELEQPKLEIIIGKLNESTSMASYLASSSTDTNFVAEMDMLSSDIEDIVKRIREMNMNAIITEYVRNK